MTETNHAPSASSINEMELTDLDVFVRQIQSRSAEHQKAMAVLFENQLYGQAVSVLRQEIDSMVRVIYLLSLDASERTPLITASVNGEKWRVTDRQMVNVTQKLYGWTLSVYKFGCSFIHLSAFHDYNDRDPLTLVTRDELASITQHCRQYHGGPQNNAPAFSDFIPYFPAILEKISGNLEYYLEGLINKETLEVAQ